MILDDVNAKGKPLTILDIGCGHGFDGDEELQRSVAERAARYIGVEPDRQITPGNYFTAVHRCLFEEAELEPGSIDIAYSIMVLEHLRTPETFWDKVWEVLADGGVFWGLTVDGRHWFRHVSRWMERLKIKNLYLDHLLGDEGHERYENYATHYRSNTPRQIQRHTSRFSSCDLINFSRVGQCNPYFPRIIHPLANLVDRQAIRSHRPGILLAIRVVK